MIRTFVYRADTRLLASSGYTRRYNHQQQRRRATPLGPFCYCGTSSPALSVQSILVVPNQLLVHSHLQIQIPQTNESPVRLGSTAFLGFQNSD